MTHTRECADLLFLNKFRQKLPFMTRSVMSNLNQILFKAQIAHHVRAMLVSIFLILLGGKVLGQQVSNNGDFRVANSAGCAPFTVAPEVLFPGKWGLEKEKVFFGFCD